MVKFHKGKSLWGRFLVGLCLGLLLLPVNAKALEVPITINGLLQSWARFGTSQKDTFFVKRAELAISGEVVKNKLTYAYMVDLARALDADETTPQLKRILQDLILTYHFGPHLAVDVGQFKIPISMEGLAGSAELDFAERAMIARTYGDQRDLGMQVKGTHENIGYTLGMFNGEGQNITTDANDTKDFAARLTVDTDILHLGASGYLGKSGVANKTKNRVGVEFKLSASSLFFSSEFITATTDTVESNGFYGTVGFKAQEDWQLAIRFDQMDPDTGASSDLIREYSLGVNYLLKGNMAKVQVNYVFVDDEALGKKNTVICAFQMAY